MPSKCNPSFVSKFANIAGRETPISIDVVINESVPRNTHFLCIPGGHELVPVINCTSLRPHFRHKHSEDIGGDPMTKWHADWQSQFPITEQWFKRKDEQIKDRRADVVLSESKRILEIQHSVINSGEVNDRNNDYKIHGYNVIWLIDAQQSIDIKQLGERTILHFTTNNWLYESFTHSCEYIYYDINGLIYKINPKLMRSNQIDVDEPKSKAAFIESLQKNTDLWTEDETTQCKLLIKQQGAGSGKTYGMMQLLNVDCEVSNYKYIIFITKQHSAVHVMYKEFTEQYNNGNLQNIEVLSDITTQDNKKYIVQYKHKLTDVETTAIFGTVDSFTYALGDKTTTSYDKFAGIAESIKNGTINTQKDGTFSCYFAGMKPILNKEMLIMIDETQDMTDLYGEAFLQVVLSKHTNLCVVGDALQSLAHEKNALLFLQSVQKPFLKTISGTAINTVRRFTNQKLIKFVNDIVPFDKYGLPQMSAASDILENRDANALNIFSVPNVYANEKEDSSNVQQTVEIIRRLFEKEVTENNRTPEDFLIVSPFSTKNPIMEALQIVLNMFWKTKMESDENYINTVKNKHTKYWKDVDTNNYQRYAIFHKSEQGTSINLSESKHATRMVTIHSSKGDGRPVVFVVGLTEQALSKFSQDNNNSRIYDSLLHVAVTRQMERLYFGLVQNGDDIHKRISTNGYTPIPQYDNLPNTKKYIGIRQFASGIANTISNNDCETWFDKINEDILLKYPRSSLKKTESTNKQLIDMGDHNLRYASMMVNTLVHYRNYVLRTDTNGQQLCPIFINVSKAKIKVVSSWNDYNVILSENNTLNNNSKHKQSARTIPLLTFRTGHMYKKYEDIICKLLTHVISYCTSIGAGQMKQFCPMESVIMYYIIECIQNPKYTAISANDLYTFVDIYNSAFNTECIGHETCLCSQLFTNVAIESITGKANAYHAYLLQHYEYINHMCEQLNNFTSNNSTVKWLYNQRITFNGGNRGFDLWNTFTLIAYDDNNVNIFYIKPQFTELNYNEFLFESLFDSYLIKNCNNHDKFAKKQIIVNVISSTCPNIYKLNWNNAIEENDALLTSCIWEGIYNKYHKDHEQYYNVFKYHVDNSAIGTSPNKIMKQIKDKLAKQDHAPEYIKQRFDRLFDEVAEEKLDAIQRYMLKSYFCNAFQRKLELSLNEYLALDE